MLESYIYFIDYFDCSLLFFNESYSFLDNFWIVIFLLCLLMHMFMNKGDHEKID